MASFKWQTEEDSSWGDAVPVNEEQVEGRERKWLPVVLVVLVIVVVGGMLFWQIRGRVGGAEEARNEDIVAAHNLLVYAAEREDPSVLLSILPVENGPWTGVQRSLASRGLLLDPWPLGIQRNGEEPVISDIELSPDLQKAEVTIEIPYQVQNQGRIETIHLRQFHQYEFRNEWRWMEPDGEYWEGQDNGRFEGATFSALYPRRDEEIVLQLITGLRGFLDDLCNEPGSPSCDTALDFLIYFEREPAVLLDLAAETEERGSYTHRFSPSSIRSKMITLPTPSLVGLPIDEDGYQALLRGYASHIVAAVLAELYEKECCPDDLTFPMFLESEMANRGLGFWPPPVLNREMEAQNDPDFALDKDISLLCMMGASDRLQLFRYDLDSNQFWRELSGRNIVRIRSAPNGKGIIAQEVDHVSEEEVLTRLIYWYDNTARILYEETLPEIVFAASNWQVHDDEQRLLLVVPDLDSRVTTFTQVDLSECPAGNCPRTTREMIGAPTWSPDGSQFLVKAGNILWWREFVGDKINQEPLGLGTVPFWLDNETFGFVRTKEIRFQEIVKAAAGDDEMSVVLDSERLRLILAEEGRPEQLMIGYVGIDPVITGEELNSWTILGFEWFSNGNLGQAYVFSYDPVENGLSVLLQSDQLHSFNVSPDGRWLAASLYDDNLSAWRLKIEPIEAGQDATLLPWQATDKNAPLRYDWTADSQWLYVLHQGVLSLYSPETNTIQLAPPPIPGCVQAAWMN